MYQKLAKVAHVAGAVTRKVFKVVIFASGVTTLSVVGFSAMQGSARNLNEKQAGKEDDRPNIVMFIADDMGYGDLGIYGSEISTPNLDAMAQEGVMFTNFHTAPSCSPTRSMLLTGVANHKAGLGQMLENLSPNQKGKPGYEGYLNDRVVTLPTLLRDNGYHTYMVGKWHLGGAEVDEKTGQRLGKPPNEHGFEQTFSMLEGGGDHYSTRGFSPSRPVNHYNENGETITELPEGFYTTDFFTDRMIENIDRDREDGKPFLAYFAYTAPHTPLQIPYTEYIDKYNEIYNRGWDELRKERFDRMKAMGLIPADMEYPERWEESPAWDEISESRRMREARRMAVYAAMLDYLDESMGRFMDHLKEIGEYDNTIFLFMSDNGGDGHDRARQEVYKEWFQKLGVNNSLENLGLPNSFASRGLEWVQVSVTPYWGEKATVTEGGIRAPLIVYYPGVIDSGTRTDALATVRDVTPTLLEYVGIKHPGTSYNGKTIEPMTGTSMMPLLSGESDRVHPADEGVVIELGGTVNHSMFMGDWKIMRLAEEPWADGTWELFNLKTDPGEQDNLASQEPERLESMVKIYQDYVRSVGYVPAKAGSVVVDPAVSGN
jgi:arylsulfatase